MKFLKRCIRYCLDRPCATFAWGLYAPLLAVAVVAKLYRLPFPWEIGALRLGDLVRSEILWITCLGFVWTMLLQLQLRTPARIAILVVGVLQWGFLVLWEVACHVYFNITGGTVLDLETIGFALRNLGEFSTVMASETPTYGVIAILGVALWPVALAFLKPWREHPDQRLARHNWGIAALCFGVAWVPTCHRADRPLGRDLTLASIGSAISEATEASVEVSEHGFPVNARLEPLSSESPYKNLVVVVLESTRPRSTTIENPKLQTTPFLAELAHRSLVAEQAYTTVPRTSKALVSILCGIRPNFAVAMTEAKPGGMAARCLASLLVDQGFRTAFFQSATQDFEERPAVVNAMGFEQFYPIESMNTDGFEKANYFGYEDDVMLPRSREWLQQRSEQPFFAAYLTVAAHHPYLAPQKRYGRIEFSKDDELNRYLNSLRNQDFFVKNLIEQYKELGLYENTLFIIVSDHGEAFGEHGRQHHNTVIYEEGLRVLSMVHAPGLFSQGDRVSSLTSHLDLLPTAVELLGYRVESGTFPGRSYLSPDTSDRPMISSCFRARSCMSMREGDLKFIHHFDNRADELFDVTNDPLEQHNLADEQHELTRELRDRLEQFRLLTQARYQRFQYERLTR